MSQPNEHGAEEKAGRPSVEELLAALFPAPPEDGSPVLEVYAILDGARDERIFRAVYESGLEYACLLSGDLPTELMEAAPYLVRLKKGDPFVRMLLEEGWGESWGVFAQTRADLETMRRHCRRILRAKDEEGNGLFFRWYDPRVLRVYLPTCTEGELKEVFGPVGGWVVEGECGEGRLFSLKGGRLSEASVAQ